MGNICTKIWGKSLEKSSTTKSDHPCRLARPPPPPRDVSALLDEVQAPADLEKSPWTTAFMRHLRTTDQKRVEAMFEFALSANYLHSLYKDLDAKEMVSDRSQWDRILKNVHERFFCENASQPVELSNLELRSELHDALRMVTESSSPYSNDLLKRTYKLVWEARNDYLVWKVGIDKAYTTFIAEKPQLHSSIISAVLLTIL